VSPAFARLPSGACPWVFPVETAHKQELLEDLARQRVRALNIWSVAHSVLPAERFPRATALRARLVGLPVHQELRESDLARLVAAVRESRLAGPRRVASGSSSRSQALKRSPI
jgi:dTDP-4-amino-4,6-dideoxygalactose transaminase